MTSLPPTALLPEVKYEQLATLCGGHGVLARTPDELIAGVKSGLERQDAGEVTIVNVLMEPGGDKKSVFRDCEKRFAEFCFVTGSNSDGWQAQRRKRRSCKIRW
jgi:thiamine pyrophosphate-dependent acetolactate synthase large subunit-like protein